MKEILTTELFLSIWKKVYNTSESIKDIYIDNFQKAIFEVVGKGCVTGVMSKTMEYAAEQALINEGYEAHKARHDNAPDIVIEGHGDPLEIKLSSNADNWMGSLFSKRHGWHLLVSYNPLDCSEVFVCLANLNQNHWKRTGDNSYVTQCTKRTLLEESDKYVLFGNIYKHPKNPKWTVIERENIKNKLC